MNERIFYAIKLKSAGEWPDDGDLFWSNDLGWVDSESKTRFTQEETTYLYLPIDGEWVVCVAEDQADDYSNHSVRRTKP